MRWNLTNVSPQFAEGNVVPEETREETRIVRPPEFKKVLEELHAVRLSNHLKSEIQARRDLEEIYHRLLEDMASMEEVIEKGRSDVEQAKTEAERAIKNQAMTRAENASLQKNLGLAKTFCYFFLGVIAALMAVSWDELSRLFLSLLSRFFS